MSCSFWWMHAGGLHRTYYVAIQHYLSDIPHPTFLPPSLVSLLSRIPAPASHYYNLFLQPTSLQTSLWTDHVLLVSSWWHLSPTILPIPHHQIWNTQTVSRTKQTVSKLICNVSNLTDAV